MPGPVKSRRTLQLVDQVTSSDGRSGDTGKTESRSSAVYRRLRDDILSGALEPGDRLPMQALAERYQVAFAPLREALSRLRSEELVAASDHRGFWIPQLSADEFRDLAGTRMLLEAQALRLSIAQGGDQWEAKIVAAFHKLSLSTTRGDHLADATRSDWELVHEEFHEALISAAASRLLLRLRVMLTGLVLRYRRIALLGGVHRDHLKEHRLIMDSVLGRDADKACAVLSEHYELTTRFILEYLGREAS